MATLEQVKARQPKWFAPENKKFFHDVDYQVLHSEKTNEPYLVRSTYAWTDMFGHKPRLHWRLNRLRDDLEIASLVDGEFPDLESAKSWLKEN